MPLLVVGILSLLVTAASFGLGIYFLIPKRKEQTEEEKKRHEIKTIWQYLGLADDTPNVYRAVVTGNETGGPIIDYIAPGERYDRTKHQTVTFIETNPFKLFVLKYTGKRVYGRPFLNNLRPLTINRVVKKSTVTKSSTLFELLDAAPVKRYGLYKYGLRPVYLENLDVGDGIRFSVIGWANFHVFDPQPAFEIYKDNFLQDMSEIISAYLSSKILQLGWEKYKIAIRDKTLFLLTELNPLLKPMGVEITQLSMSDPEFHKDIQAAMEKEVIADRTAKARTKEGEGEKNYKIQVAEGEAQAKERLAKADAAPIKELINLYYEKGASEETAVELANEQVLTRINAEAVGKLTGTYAPNTDKVVTLKQGG